MSSLSELLAKEDKKRFVLYLDNCRIHKTQEVMNLIKDKGLFVVFGIPYAAEYNLAEYVFSLLKRKHYRKVYQTESLV